MPRNGGSTGETTQTNFVNRSSLDNEYIEVIARNLPEKNRKEVYSVVESEYDQAKAEPAAVIEAFNEHKNSRLKGLELGFQNALLEIEREELRIKIRQIDPKNPISSEEAEKALKEIAPKKQATIASFEAQRAEIIAFPEEKAIGSRENGVINYLAGITRVEFKRQMGGVKEKNKKLNEEANKLKQQLTHLKKHKVLEKELEKIEKIENINQKFLSPEEINAINEQVTIRRVHAADEQLVKRTESLSGYKINETDDKATKFKKYMAVVSDKLKIQEELESNEKLIEAIDKKTNESAIGAVDKKTNEPVIGSVDKMKIQEEKVVSEKVNKEIPLMDNPISKSNSQEPVVAENGKNKLFDQSGDDLRTSFKIPRARLVPQFKLREENLEFKSPIQTQSIHKESAASFVQSDGLDGIGKENNGMPQKEVKGMSVETLDESISSKKAKSWEELSKHNLEAKVALLEQRVRIQTELLKVGPLRNFLLDPTMKKNEKKGRLAEIKKELAENTQLLAETKAILQDKGKLAEYVEKTKPKDKHEIIKEGDNLERQTAEIEGKVSELKDINYKDLKNKWYHIFSRPSFYAFLGRQALWTVPLFFINAIPGYVSSVMPEISFAEKGAQVISSVQALLVGSYVGQKLFSAIPKVAPRVAERFSRGARKKFPAAMEKVDKGLAPVKSIGQKVKQTQQKVKGKTNNPLVKKSKQVLRIGNGEKLTPEQKAMRAKGLNHRTGEKLPLATRAKNTSVDFMKSAGKRVWRNKASLALMVAMTLALTLAGGGFLAAAFPAFAGTVLGAFSCCQCIYYL
ncbi:hypothetical protein [Enterococcus ratti]|uniref:Uncharacterized protein n=1 Tax=Enterococcus ratti TaxID=150033 RepID=A0A1L8WRH9_9ENTE|nr:hypothetical protein [Enterococcus ratti]OJG83637.1 hypothetical protein RV14_GL000871 [Enterococcus ratti]